MQASNRPLQFLYDSAEELCLLQFLAVIFTAGISTKFARRVMLVWVVLKDTEQPWIPEDFAGHRLYQYTEELYTLEGLRSLRFHQQAETLEMLEALRGWKLHQYVKKLYDLEILQSKSLTRRV